MLKELRTHVYKSINQYGLNSYFKGKNISFRSQSKILLIVVYHKHFQSWCRNVNKDSHRYNVKNTHAKRKWNCNGNQNSKIAPKIFCSMVSCPTQSPGLWIWWILFPQLNCYMTQLDLNKKNYLGGPNIITAHFRSREFSLAGESRESQKSEALEGFNAPFLAWKWGGPLVAFKSCEQPPGESPKRNKDLSLVNTRTWIMPTRINFEAQFSPEPPDMN